MMFLAIQSKGLNPDNAKFKEGLQMALVRLGHEVDTYGPGHAIYEQNFSALYQRRKWDVVLLMEDYDRSNWVPNVWGLRSYRVFISMDSHMALQSHLKACNKQKVHLALSAVWESVKAFERRDREAAWFPNAYPEDLIGPRNVQQVYPVGHCGNWANRRPWLEQLKQRVGIHMDIGVIGEAMVLAINSYQIHWNRNISFDINCRTFETMGCGIMLLTNETPGLTKLMEPGKHCVTYDTLDECVEKIKYYTEHEDERHEIAAAGLAHAQATHTYDCRAAQLVEMIERRI